MADEFKVRKALVVTGNSTVTGSASVGGAQTIAGNLSVTGTSTLAGGVSGNTSFSGNVTIAQNLVVTGDLTVTGSFSFSGGSVFPDDTFEVQDEIDDTKVMGFSLGGATTGTKTTLFMSQTANRNIAFPDASTNLVGDDTSQTLTNKAINASNNTITNLADANIAAAAAIALSKLASITANRAVASDGSGFLVATSVTSTELGYLSGVGSQVVGISDTNTLTNKTISAGSNTISGLGDANIDSAAAIARSKLANGTASHVVINNGGGVMSSEAQLSAVRGGTGADLSAATGVLYMTAGVGAAEAQLDETRGGTGIGTYATGDTLYASASNTLAKRSIGTAGQIMKTGDAGIPVWEDTNYPTMETRLFEDWHTDAVGVCRWLDADTGTGVSATGLTVSDTTHHGILELDTGASATGAAIRYLGGVTTGTGTAGFKLGGGELTMEWDVRVEDLSTAGERYSFMVGLFSTATTQVDAVRFFYNDSINAGNWTISAINASTVTNTDSGVAVAADTWYKLKAVVNAAGTSIEYFINGVSVGTVTTNIPTANIAPRASMAKTVGTAARMAYVDYFRLYQRLTSSR